MKSQIKQEQTLGVLRGNLLAAVAELDLKGTDSRVTQAMFIIEEAFNSLACGQKLDASQIYRSGVTRAKIGT
jgi:hypothetical protein